MLATTAFTDGEASSTEPPRRVAGVYIDEQAGLLSPAEELLLRHLATNMIPLPDTVRIRVDSVHYGVFSPIGGEIVLLSHDRFRTPNSLDRSPPYLYGRVTATPPRIDAPAPKYTHTLAHEVAHYLTRRLDDHTPRPAWGHAGTMTAIARAQEVEAELIAAVLEHMAFGTRLSDLGYPDSVRVAGVGPRSTHHLLREYQGIIADNWRLTAVGL
jgi:hypothetical protein